MKSPGLAMLQLLSRRKSLCAMLVVVIAGLTAVMIQSLTVIFLPSGITNGKLIILFAIAVIGIVITTALLSLITEESYHINFEEGDEEDDGNSGDDDGGHKPPPLPQGPLARKLIADEMVRRSQKEFLIRQLQHQNPTLL